MLAASHGCPVRGGSLGAPSRPARLAEFHRVGFPGQLDLRCDIWIQPVDAGPLAGGAQPSSSGGAETALGTAPDSRARPAPGPYQVRLRMESAGHCQKTLGRPRKAIRPGQRPNSGSTRIGVADTGLPRLEGVIVGRRSRRCRGRPLSPKTHRNWPRNPAQVRFRRRQPGADRRLRPHRPMAGPLRTGRQVAEICLLI